MITFEPLAGRGILFPTDAQAIDATRAGGKAAGLARLHDAGCDVPPWFVITPDCEINADAINEALTRLVAHVTIAPIVTTKPIVTTRPIVTTKPIVTLSLSSLGCATTFAVRSSAVVEDGANASYAGQFTSLLFVPRDGVLEAIRRVRESAGNDNVRAYAANRGIVDW